MFLYFKYLAILFKSKIQYKVSFILLSLGNFLHPFFAYIGMFLLFERFENIGGWSFIEVALCLGIANLVFAFCECFARGFDTFSRLIVSGGFDRILLRPRGTIIQVLGSNIEFTRIGRFLQGLLVFVYALINAPVKWHMYKIITLVFMLTSGVVIFTGVFILGATFCFWTVQGLEFVNLFTDGGREMTQYPLTIYSKWIRRFFTFIIPYGCINYLPLLYIFDKVNGNAILYMLTPLIGMLFIIPCLFVWRTGVNHYNSTGS